MMYRPQFLCPGDSVSIVSPASIINPDYVKGATGVLESWSLGVTVSSHCLDHSGVYSGTIDERMNDFRHALYDPAVKAVLCSRGGYGAVHLLDGLTDDIARNPKWIIGFSDISALHALCVSRGRCRSAVYGNRLLLKDGKVPPLGEDKARHPRTAAGLAGNTLLLVVIDGRARESAGVTFAELATLLKDLGCTDAVNLDGGGSSTMWTRHHGVVNHPSDNRKFDHAGERPVHNALYLISGR